MDARAWFYQLFDSCMLEMSERSWIPIVLLLRYQSKLYCYKSISKRMSECIVAVQRKTLKSYHFTTPSYNNPYSCLNTDASHSTPYN